MRKSSPDPHPQKHIHAPDSGDMAKQRTAPDPRIAMNLERLMGKAELSQSRLAVESKVGQSTISRILGGEDSPTTRTLSKLAKALGVTVNDFFRDREKVPAAKAPAPRYPLKDDPQPEYAGPVPPTRQVPVVGTAKLGENGWYDELSTVVGEGDGYVEVSTQDQNAYALTVRGDSMHPAIRDGWVVVVEPNNSVAAGEYVVIGLTDGRKMVKELLYERRDSVAVISVNGGERLTLDRGDIAFLHPVAAVFPPSRWKR
jgi:phage repressor protein C with HTH and peptisase S24 domain